MEKDSAGEGRLRRYAQAFRREANPPADVATRLVSGLASRRRTSRFGVVPAFAAAAGVLVVGLVIAFGAMQLRAMGRPTHGPPVTLTTATPSASPDTTPTPSASPSATPTATPTPRPAGTPMQLIDLSFADASHGWAIGSVCAQPDNCPLQLRATLDGGRIWFAVSAPQVQALQGNPGWQVRFVSDQVGWLFGPRLFRTTDGGQTWSDAGFGHAVLSLGASGSSVWAVAADCNQGQCLRMTLYRSGDQGRSWSRASAQPAMVGAAAQLMRVSDSTGWVLSWSTTNASLDSALAVTHDGGQSWQRLVRPCAPETSIADAGAALADGTLWIICGGDHAMGQERKQVIVSHDGGLHWNFPPDAPARAFVGQLALSGTSHAWLATIGGPLYSSGNGGATWVTADGAGVSVDPNGPGVHAVTFVDSLHGWAATDHEVFWTSDGGAHWGHTAI
ncbi:MAG: YCF48-related protein [Candidatus Dormibacteraeota bacterium]|nr:YCF48-related protein [Candidatus Dormibacteraeota bacterium]